jgi:hypothetical protein
MPGAIPARHLVIEIADFHNKIGTKRPRSRLLIWSLSGGEADIQRTSCFGSD